MKRLVIWLIGRYADDRSFRINVCKELHKNAQSYFGEQTVPGRYYEACEEFFMASPLTKKAPDWYRGGIMDAFERAKTK